MRFRKVRGTHIIYGAANRARPGRVTISISVALVAELEIKVERGGGMAAATVAATVQLVRHNAEGSVMTFTE